MTETPTRIPQQERQYQRAAEIAVASRLSSMPSRVWGGPLAAIDRTQVIQMRKPLTNRQR
jgi:hypothetical protein